MEVVAKARIEGVKQRVRKAFEACEKSFGGKEGASVGEKRPGLLYKTEVKKMLGSITKANNNQSESLLAEHDKDQDDYLTIEEVITLVASLASQRC